MTALTAQGICKVFQMEPPRTDTFSKMVKFFSGSVPRLPFHALRDISLELGRGQALALCGPNGSGKTTLLRILAGILPPSAGTVTTRGKTTCMLGFGSIIQDRLSVEENAKLCSIFFELDGPLKENAARLIGESGLEKFRNARLEELSSGMRIRLPFMAAMNSGADIFFIDEALAVGDSEFQSKCFDKLMALKKRGASMIYATHSPGAVEELTDGMLLLEAGRRA